MQSQSNLGTENRLLAALAHASVAMQGLGVLVGVVVYFNQREKSRFAAYQALQAAIYQLLNLILIGVLWVAWGIYYTLSMTSMIRSADQSGPPPEFFVALGSTAIPIVVMLIVIVYGLWAAIKVWQGRDFRYPWLGAWLERSGLWNSK